MRLAPVSLEHRVKLLRALYNWSMLQSFHLQRTAALQNCPLNNQRTGLGRGGLDDDDDGDGDDDAEEIVDDDDADDDYDKDDDDDKDDMGFL